jgi:sec-independent protein translocase protein TatA
MPNLRPAELIALLAIVVLLFGAKRLPDAARGLGRSLRIFKAETKGLTESGDSPSVGSTGATDAGSTAGSTAVEAHRDDQPDPQQQPRT